MINAYVFLNNLLLQKICPRSTYYFLKQNVYFCSGCAAAYKLKLHGLNVTVFEADGRVGGKLRSISQDGLIWDEGANTMVYLTILWLVRSNSAYTLNLVSKYVNAYLVQTESEADVSGLLDDLGLRDKQQFVSCCVWYNNYFWKQQITISFLICYEYEKDYIHF